MISDPKFLDVKVNKEWIEKLGSYSNSGLLKYPRRLRNSQVNKLHKLLQEGGHWHTPIVINKITRGDKLMAFHVIDGTHRIFALQRYYRNDSNQKMEFIQSVAVYTNLSEEEERDIYEKWSMGMRQTPQDWIVVNQDEILLWQKIEDEKSKWPPINMQGVKDSYPFKTLFFASRCMFEKDIMSIDPVFSELDDFKNESNRFFSDKQNLKKLNEFCQWFVREFGAMVSRNNVWCRPNLFYPIIDIYMQNIDRAVQKEMSARFNKIKGNMKIQEKGSKATHTSIKRELRKQILNLLNKGVKRQEDFYE